MALHLQDMLAQFTNSLDQIAIAFLGLHSSSAPKSEYDRFTKKSKITADPEAAMPSRFPAKILAALSKSRYQVGRLIAANEAQI
jgi:hypothetical protein